MTTHRFAEYLVYHIRDYGFGQHAVLEDLTNSAALTPEADQKFVYGVSKILAYIPDFGSSRKRQAAVRDLSTDVLEPGDDPRKRSSTHQSRP